MLAPLVVIFAVTPLVVLVALVIVAVMTPRGGAWSPSGFFPSGAQARQFTAGAIVWSAVDPAGGDRVGGVAALVAGAADLILPPLIWGWLTYRVMSL